MEEEIKEVCKLTSFAFKPEILEKILLELKSVGNFKYFIKELKLELQKPDKSKAKRKVYEVIAAYKLKKLEYNVAFLAEGNKIKDIDIEIIPSTKTGKITGSSKTPDLWVYAYGKWLFVEVKFIEEITDKAKILRAVFTDEVNHEKEVEITSSRIAGEFKEATKQVRTFGDGFVYIFCERWKVDMTKVKNKLDRRFKENPEIYALILNYRTISPNGLSTTIKTEVILNKYRVAGLF